VHTHRIQWRNVNVAKLLCSLSVCVCVCACDLRCQFHCPTVAAYTPLPMTILNTGKTAIKRNYRGEWPNDAVQWCSKSEAGHTPLTITTTCHCIENVNVIERSKATTSTYVCVSIHFTLQWCIETLVSQHIHTHIHTHCTYTITLIFDDCAYTILYYTIYVCIYLFRQGIYKGGFWKFDVRFIIVFIVILLSLVYRFRCRRISVSHHLRYKDFVIRVCVRSFPNLDSEMVILTLYECCIIIYY